MLDKNIVLCGFMGCGKTTAGKELASLLKMEFVDLDKWIEEKEGLTVSKIFEKKGEEYFRTAETRAAENLGQKKGLVIACGGGTVLKPENILSLKKNGVIIYLSVTADVVKSRLKADNTRPLLAKDKENTIDSLLNFRKPLYEKAADFTVDANEALQTTVNQIINFLALEE